MGVGVIKYISSQYDRKTIKSNCSIRAYYLISESECYLDYPSFSCRAFMLPEVNPDLMSDCLPNS